MRYAKWELIREQWQFDELIFEEKDGEQKILGRGGKNRVLCESEFVSRKHCCITYRNGAFHLQDLKSTNGTYLNGHKLAGNHDRELRDGDLIGLGIANIEQCPSDQYFLFRFTKVGKPLPLKVKTEPVPVVPKIPVIIVDDDEDDEDRNKNVSYPHPAAFNEEALSSRSSLPPQSPSTSTKVGTLQPILICPDPPKLTPSTVREDSLPVNANEEKTGRLEVTNIKKEIGVTNLAPVNLEPNSVPDSKSFTKPTAIIGKLIKVEKPDGNAKQVQGQAEPKPVTNPSSLQIPRPRPGPLCSKPGSPLKKKPKPPVLPPSDPKPKSSESVERINAELLTQPCSPMEITTTDSIQAKKSAVAQENAPKRTCVTEIVNLSSSSSDEHSPPTNVEDQRKRRQISNDEKMTKHSTNQNSKKRPAESSDSYTSNKYLHMSIEKDKKLAEAGSNPRTTLTTLEGLEKVKRQAQKIMQDAQQEQKELGAKKKGKKRTASDFNDDSERESKRMRPIPSWVGRPLPDLVPTSSASAQTSSSRSEEQQSSYVSVSAAARPQPKARVVPRKAIMIGTNYAPRSHGLPSLHPPLKRTTSDSTIPGAKTLHGKLGNKHDTSLPLVKSTSTVKPACRVKTVSNSRTDKLARSLSNDTPSAKPATATNGALAPVSSEIAALMPVMQIMSDMGKASPPVEDSRQFMPPPPIKPVRPKVNWEFYKDLNKNGRLPPVLNDKNTSGTKSGPSGSGTSSSIGSGSSGSPSPSDSQSSTLPEEVYRQVLDWNTNWLNEQQKVKASPPVYGSRKLVTNLSVFVDYGSYIDTLYPLMLLELWAGVFSEYFRQNRNRPSERSWGRCTFDVLVQRIDTKDHCPMLPPLDKAAKRSLLTSATPSKPYWHCIQLSTLTENKDLNKSNDFGILTVNILKGGVKVSRSVFGFFLTESELYEEVKISSLGDQYKLFPENPNYKYKYTVTFVTRLKEYHDMVKTNLGKVERFAYISAKMRDFRAMSILPNSKLFEQIIHSTIPDASEVYQPSSVVNVAGLVKDTLDLLNPVQRGVVQYISERVSRPGSDLLLVHGPPGTGKTRTIVGLVLQILKANKSKTSKPKLLICTPSNGAIDEIIRRLDTALGAAFKIVRIGQGGPDVKKYHLEELSKTFCSGAGQLESIRAAINLTETKIKTLNDQLTGLGDPVPNDTLGEALKREICDLKNKRKQYVADLDKTKNNRKALERAKIEVLQRADVVCSTLSSCCNSFVRKHISHRRDKNMPSVFTCCILDEATQATEPESLSPLLLNIDKLILVGDPMQLPATVISPEAEQKLFNQSLFARLYNFYESQPVNPVMMLTVQYRMNEEILHWPNMRFYRNKLTTSNSVKTDPSRELRLKPYLFLNINSREAVNGNRQFSNAMEVKLIKEILLTIKRQTSLHPNHANLTIGIITPYYEQRIKLLTLVEDFKETDKDFASLIEVDTVDSFQGREKDIILLSCVRTEELGFLKTPQRLNVSLTRAKMCLYVIGNAACLNADSMWKSLMDDAASRGLYETIPDDDPVHPAKFGKIIEKCLLRPNVVA